MAAKKVKAKKKLKKAKRQLKKAKKALKRAARAAKHATSDKKVKPQKKAAAKRPVRKIRSAAADDAPLPPPVLPTPSSSFVF